MGEGDPREQLLRALRGGGAMTVDALAEALHLSKTATRAHVLQLEERGLITREEGAAAGPGRPPVRVALTRAGGAVFPTQDADILSQMIEFIDENGHGALVERFFASIWARRREALRARLGEGEHGLDARLAALEALLREHQFMPVIERLGGKGEVVRVRECNCPLPAAVRATRIPCRLEVDFLAEAVCGRAVEVALAADRSQSCVFVFEVAGVDSEDVARGAGGATPGQARDPGEGERR
jgi:predicted ArsR family transcriptional regulator